MRWTGMVAALAIGVAACTASTHAPARAATTPAPDACAAAVHLACWQDHTTTGVMQDIEVFDHNGAPEFWINNAGGTWAGNDRLGVTGKSVFADVAYLSPFEDGKLGPCPVVAGCRGVLVLDGQVLTAADIATLHMMERAHVTMRDLRWLARRAR